MKCYILEWLALLKEFPHPARNKFTSRMSRIDIVLVICPIGLTMVLWLILPRMTAAQIQPSTTPEPSSEVQKCAALGHLNLENVPGGPALITSARLVDVPASGLEQWPITAGGFGKMGAQITTNIRQYCDVRGYAAPQNKFELKLPPPRDWNQNFFFSSLLKNPVLR